MVWDLLPTWLRVLIGIAGFFGFFIVIIAVVKFVPSIWLGSLILIIFVTPPIGINVLRKLLQWNEQDGDGGFSIKKERLVKTRNTLIWILVAVAILMRITDTSALIEFSKAHLKRYSYSIETYIDHEGDEEEIIEFQLGNPIVNFILNRFMLIFVIVSILGVIIIYFSYQKNIRLLEEQAWNHEKIVI